MERASFSRKSARGLKRVAAMKDSEVLLDGNLPAWKPAMFERAVDKRGRGATRNEALLSLRMDSDVLERFRTQGRGYRLRMNAVLRA